MTSLFKALERADAERRLLEHVEAPAPTLPVPVRQAPAAKIEQHNEFEKLKVTLMLEASRRPLKDVLLLSAARGEGVSTVTLQVAAALAPSTPQGVLLLEAHTGEPALAERLGLAPRYGLGDVLAGSVGWQAAVLPTGIPGLSLLPGLASNGGGPAPAGAVSRMDRLDDLRRELKSRFDFCLIDGGSLERSPEGAALAAGADGVLVVVEAERTSSRKVREAVQMILRAHASILGIVLNRRRDYLPAFVRHRLE